VALCCSRSDQGGFEKVLGDSGKKLPKKEQKVLCADDDADILRMLDVALDYCGFEAVLAHNGQQAIEEFRKNRNSIVACIMDLRMPVKNGLDAAKQIRAEAPDVLLIALSAYIGVQKDGIHVKECQDAGFNAWTTKPFAIEPLIGIIQEWLAQKTPQQKT
jgi:CheY-like chemotaxis protein